MRKLDCSGLFLHHRSLFSDQHHRRTDRRTHHHRQRFGRPTDRTTERHRLDRNRSTFERLVTSATINYGGTATYKLTVQSQDGYIGSLAVTCANAPSGMRCTPNPDSLAFAANASTATVVFTVAPAGAAKSATSSFQWIMGSVVSVALLLGIFPARLRRQRCELIGYLAFLAACFLLWTMAACGGGNSSSGMTTEANYTLQAVFTTPTGESVNQPLKLTVIQQSAQ